jgi:spermidine synthase
VEEDAFQFVKNSKDQFQLIIIDLFIDTEVPPIFFGKEFCINASKLLQTGGYLIFNAGINLAKTSKTIETVSTNFGSDFQFQHYKNVQGTNTLLVAQKGSL